MRWKTHESVGITAYTIGVSLACPQQIWQQNIMLVYLLIVPLISSILPDVLDQKLGLKHRGFSHSLLCTLILSLGFSLPFFYLHAKLPIINQVIPIYAIIFGFAIGYLLHVICDAFTDYGVHLFWPYKRNKRRKAIYQLWTYRTGENHELKIALVCVVIASLIWGFKIVYPIIKAVNSFFA